MKRGLGIIAVLALALAGCQAGDAEKAGEAIGEAAEEAVSKLLAGWRRRQTGLQSRPLGAGQRTREAAPGGESVLVVGLTLGSISLPIGTLEPTLEAAGPPAPSESEIRIAVDAALLNRHGLPFPELLDALRNRPPLDIRSDPTVLGQLPIPGTGASAAFLRDLAVIRFEPAGPRRPVCERVVRVEGASPEVVDG